MRFKQARITHPTDYVACQVYIICRVWLLSYDLSNTLGLSQTCRVEYAISIFFTRTLSVFSKDFLMVVYVDIQPNQCDIPRSMSY